MHFLLGGNESKREVYMNVSNVGASFGPDVGTYKGNQKKYYIDFSQNFLSMQTRELLCGKLRTPC